MARHRSESAHCSRCGYYSAKHFTINSDINALLSDEIGWRKRERAFEDAFQRFERLTVVVQAPTPELASAATGDLAKALKERTDRFKSVNRPAGGEFFARNGLLFMPTAELSKKIEQLVQAEMLINDLATDESLRGLTSALGDVLLGVQSEKVKLDDVAPVFDKFSATIEDVVAGRPANFSWQAWLVATRWMLISYAASSTCVRSSTTGPRTWPCGDRNNPFDCRRHRAKISGDSAAHRYLSQWPRRNNQSEHRS